ncbi:uncharacterized protein LOC131214323, partial [Anopheles bellator]|uniref:uncharacterized protein LOC131214323 n=1 Tax=Anopheles bellator TaxID=139047 RepID=UPI002647891C
SPTGLMMYRYNETITAFERVYYSTAFSTLRGWTRRTIETISTIDIVGDGMDELFASGPKGLVALQADSNEFGFGWNNIFDEHIAEQSIRYALPEHVRKMNISSNQIEVFLHTSQGLSVIKAAQYIAKQNHNIYEPAKSKDVGPDNERSIPELVSQRTYTLWLHDQLDLSNLLQPLSPHSGTVELTLPLIEIRNPFGVNVRKIFQYKNIDYSNELGHGWSFPLDCIMVDRTTSAFSEDHVYSLVKDNQRIILTRLHGQTEQNDEIGFEIEGYDEMEIHYQQQMNRWNVTIDKRTLMYSVINNYQMLNVCTTWPLCGSNSTKEVPLPTIWYLTMEYDHNGQGNARYDYEIVKNETDIRLSKITLHDDSTVEIAYDHGRVHSFSVKTAKYKQFVHIRYTTDNKHLRAITQSDRPLFEFEYDHENRLSKMVLPNGAVWIPNYFDLPIDSSALQKSFAINHEATIFYGPDYMVIVDANHVHGKLELHIRDPLGAMHEPKMNQTITVTAEPNFKNHIVHAIECLLVVNVVYSTHKVVTVIQYSDQGWVQRQHYENNPLEGMVMTGNRFVLISDTKELHVLSVNETGVYQDAIVRTGLPKNFVIHAFSHGYATYDGHLRIFLLRDSGNWLEVPTSVGWDAFASIDNFISSFDINKQLADSIRRSLVADMLGSYRQAIVLKAPKFTKTLLEIWVRFAVIDLKAPAPQMQYYYTTKVEMANMRGFKYTVRTKDNDEFILGYQWHGGKYHLRVRNSTGPHRNEFNRYIKEVQQSRSTMHYREWAEHWNKTVTLIKQEYARIYKKVKESVVFAMDLSQFGMLTNQEGVLVAGHQITNDGHNWPKKRLSDETQRLYKVDKQLSAAYRLVKSHKHDNFKIVSIVHNTTVFDMGTTSPKEIQLVLPYYAQAQRPGGRLKAFFFDTQQTVTFAVNETMHRASNQLALITTARKLATHSRSYMLFRSVKYFITSKVTVLEKQTLTSPNERPLITEFLYNAKDLQLTANGFIFQRLQIVPGGNRTRFGWYEQSIDLETGDTLRKAFAADGREVIDTKLREQQKKAQQSETEDSRSTLRDHDRTIMDKGYRLQVLDLGPYRLADEMVSYYGFEQYENNHFGSQTRWIFNESLVRLESENRYLQLTGKNQTLTGMFMPAEPNTTFVVSCWIRVPAASLAFQANQAGDVLTVHVRRFAENMENTTSPTNVTTSSAVQIKHSIGSWNYIETIVDASHFPPATKLHFLIAVAPTDTLMVIDVDHIRFSPLSMPLAINIYKPITGEVGAVLNGNGLLRCCFYNPQGKKSIMFSEQGEVLEFSMESKIMYTRQSRRRPCSVEMKPRYGSLDDFQSEPWHMTGPGWTVEKGFVSYNGTEESTLSKSFNKPYKTVGIRFLYELNKQEVRLSFDWRDKRLPLYCINNKPFNCPLPPLYGEILIVITEKRASLWLDGVLLRETVFTISAPHDHVFQLHTTGSFAVTEFLEMYEPRTKITYHTFSGHPVQLVVYDDADTVRVREIWYDQVERPVMQTKWTKMRVEPNVSHFFGFYENFVTNMNDKTGIMSGIVADLHPACQGFPYTRTIYGNDPTDSKHLQGLPGKEYGVGGKYRRRYSNRPPSRWLDKIFPTTDGYYHKVGEHPGGALRLTVEDSLGNKVAKYSKVGNFEDRLTTYRYSDAAKLLQELPPLYHSTARSLAALSTPYFSRNFTDHQKALQKIWEVKYDYDEKQRVIRKRTPDGGIFNYLYDRHGALRFTLHKNQNETLVRAIHFLYSSNGKIAREAVVNLTYDQCKEILENGRVPESRNSIETLYGEQDKLPAARYRSQLATRYIGDDQMTEYLIFGERELLLKKLFIVNTTNTTYSIDFEWENDKLRSVQYPVSFGQGSMKYIYDYNGHGEVTSIRMPANKDPVFEFTYNADGMVETMTVQPGTEHS